LECIQVGYNPKQDSGTAACIVTFKNGIKVTLPHGRVSNAPTDGEVFLECAGGRPTRCTIGIW